MKARRRDETTRVAARAAILVVCLASTAGVVAQERRDAAVSKPPAGMVTVPAGSYVPLYRPPTSPTAAGPGRAGAATPAVPVSRRVEAFQMDVFPVTNGEYLEFVRQHPEWRKWRVKKLFAEESYLSHWKDELDPGPLAPADSPVVNVSWFAARAYLKAQGKELPTVDQWEYAAAASETRRDASRDAAFIDRLRVWYGQAVPDPLPSVRTGFRNVYGIRGLHGLVWEWTLDFNSALVSGESRADSALERSLYCGSGASGAADFENYPAFMRYALRSSLQARYAVGSLGFRGVRNLPSGGTR
ncbi:MAG: formylglycine-generating enzyme family protein [Acidobacteria bacterium]|nr:formylglycine-generating enzyme family protein [Acidobacteriota bacterium]